MQDSTTSTTSTTSATMSGDAAKLADAEKFTPFSLIVGAFSADEYDDAPRWAKVLVDEDLIQKVLKLSQLCKTHNLAEAATHDGPYKWDDEVDLRLRNDRMLVSADVFYFSACPKYGHMVETRPIQIEGLLKILQADKSVDGACPGRFEVKGGAVFFNVESYDDDEDGDGSGGPTYR